MPEGIVGEFFACKSEADADLLAMQVGDFYEFFGEDAELVGEELDLKVSRKSSGGESYPMAGVPVDDLTPYLRALVERGYRVAVADQHETDDGHARSVTRVVTPGTLLEPTDAAARYLAGVVRTEGRYGLAFADVTTGRFLATAVADAAAAAAELARFDPTEVLPGPELRGDDGFLDRVRDATAASLSVHDAAAFGPGRARRALAEQFGEGVVGSVGLDDAAASAAGAVVAYVDATGAGVAASMTRLRAYEPSDHVDLDATTQRTLELVETMEGDREGSLLATVDHTVTSPGRRRLREWLLRPRRDPGTIGRRLDSVEALAGAALARERTREALSGVNDLERLASRAASGSADATDLLAVRDGLETFGTLVETVEGGRLAGSPLAAILGEPDGAAAAALADRIDGALVEDPPATVREGGLFQRGYDDDLDDLIERHEAAKAWIDDLPEREKARTGITHLTVDRNRTDGYYIQVGKSETDAVPDEYREVKTLKNSRRYVTDELAEHEREVLRLEEARAEREHDLFVGLRDAVAERAELLQDVGRALATVDALAALAEHAATNDWTRPRVVEPGPLRIEAGRHPVVEATTDFVPNDLRLAGAAGGGGRDAGRDGGSATDAASDPSFLLVTGPNMSGKSTYLRGAALVTLLAQAGSFVPADAATVGVVDGIYTRVGALDELAGGRSTFMVEMQELSNILHSATDESLVVLDEVGRGTATYDGISIAWAATEYLSAARATAPTPKTLFATHYHELADLVERLPGAANAHMAAEERDGEVTFLRTVREGPADRSYGVHVAELAGVPDPVTDRARQVLDRLRADEAIEVRGADGSDANADADANTGTGAGGTEQVVFDLDSGRIRGADGGERDAAGAAETDTGGDAARSGAGEAAGPGGPAAGGSAGASGAAGDPAAADVLAELRETAVEETPPVELMARVREWQRRLDGRADAGEE
ncbi:MAG: DNA mismatch repair protein MutS [Haloferacaceae archaeon]